MKKKSIRPVILMCCCLSAALLGVHTAVSYFSSLEEVAALTARAAVLDLSREGAGIRVDCSELDEHLQPYKEGEEVRIRFSTSVQGTADIYAVPKLSAAAKGLSPGDRILVRLLNAEGEELAAGSLTASAGEEAAAELYGEAERFKPGDSPEYELVLFMEKLSESSIPLLDYDFQLAAVQAKGNEELMEGDREPLEKFREAEERAKDKDSDAKGFAFVKDLSDAADQNGDAISKEALIPHLIRFLPKTGDTEETVYTWYLKSGDAFVPLEGSEKGELNLTLSSRQCPRELYLEVKNRAGTVRSAVYCLESVGGLSIVVKGKEGEGS